MTNQQVYQPKSLDVIVLRGQWWNPMLPVVMVRTQTRWTHCIMVRSHDGRIYDAHTPGVECRELNVYNGRHAAVLRRRDIESIPLADKVKMLAWADQLVKDENGYDFLALMGFMTGIKSFNRDDRWYCAELPLWMFAYHGWPLFNGEPKFIFPADHYRCRLYEIIYEGVLNV